MTERDFIEAAKLGILDTNQQINFNFNPVRGEGGPFTLSGLIVSTTPKNEDKLSNINLENVLRQVERIKFTYRDKEFRLEITDKQFVAKIPLRPPFFYFRIEPNVIPDGFFTNAELGADNTDLEQGIKYADVAVVFEPFIVDLQYSYSEYNAILGNAIDSRTSRYIRESDRNTSSTLPSNFDSIVNGTANFAQIQDSLYSNTGWSNARYKGTKTSSKTYNNLPATLSGTTFRGEEFSIDSSATAICGIPSDSRIVKTFLHTGETKLPQLQAEKNPETRNAETTILFESISSSTQTLIKLDQVNEERPVKAGDLLIIGGIKSNVPETVKVLKVYNISENRRDCEVIRGYNNTAIRTHSTGLIVHYADTTNRLVTFTGNSSKFEAMNNSRVWINDTNSIAYTDDFGIIFKLENC